MEKHDKTSAHETSKQGIIMVHVQKPREYSLPWYFYAHIDYIDQYQHRNISPISQTP